MIYPVPKPKHAKRKKGPTPKEKGVIRRYVFARDEYKCQHKKYLSLMGGELWEICNKPVIWESGYPNSGHLAHIIPRSRGGTWELSNLLTKCAECHIGIEHSYGPSGEKPVPRKVIDTDID